MSDAPQDFESTLATVSTEIVALQSALRAAIESVLPVSTGARACGRALGLTRFLGWAIWNLAYAPDVPAAIRSLPGDRGWTSVIAALRKAGCPDARLERLAACSREVSRRFSSKQINITLLRSIASGGLDTERDASRMRKARRDARAAAEILHGVRVSLNAGITVFGRPDPDGWIDFATASLFEGLERLRPGPAWPIYRRSIHRHPSDSAPPRRKPIEAGPLAPLVPSLSTPGAANGELRLVDDPVLPTIEFTAPRANRTGGLRASFAESARRAISIPADLSTGDSALVLTVPARWAVYHLALHRDLPRVGEPTVALYAPPDPMEVARRGLEGFEVLESNRLPLDARVETVDDPRLPARFRSCEAAYRSLLDRTVRAMGRTSAEFVHVRVEVSDPPLHGSVVLRWQLRRRTREVSARGRLVGLPVTSRPPRFLTSDPPWVGRSELDRSRPTHVKPKDRERPMNRTLHSRRANLAAGVALLGCALAAAGRASAQNMQITTVTGITFSGTGTYSGASPGFVTVPSINWTGSMNYIAGTDSPFFGDVSINGGELITRCFGYDGPGYDIVKSYVGSPWITDWALSGTFTVVLSQAANVGLINGTGWLVNGNPLADGDLVGAGTHTFTWGENRSTDIVYVGLTFTPGGGGAVPLPGAAGLAACGLLAVGRRRRR